MSDVNIHVVQLRWQVNCFDNTDWNHPNPFGWNDSITFPYTNSKSSKFRFQDSDWKLNYFYNYSDRSYVLKLQRISLGYCSSSPFVASVQLEDGETGGFVPGLSEKTRFTRFDIEEVVWKKFHEDVFPLQSQKSYGNDFKLRFLVVLEKADDVTDAYIRTECSIPEVAEQSTDAGSVQTTNLRRKPTLCQERLLKHVANFMPKSGDSGVYPTHMADMWNAVKHLFVPEEGANAGLGIGQELGAGSGQDTEVVGAGSGSGAGGASGVGSGAGAEEGAESGSGEREGGANNRGSGAGAGEDSKTIETGCSIPEVAGQSTDAGSARTDFHYPQLDYILDVALRNTVATLKAGAGSRTGPGVYGQGLGAGSGQDIGDSRTIQTGCNIPEVAGQSTHAKLLSKDVIDAQIDCLTRNTFADMSLGAGAASGTGLGGYGRGLGAGAGSGLDIGDSRTIHNGCACFTPGIAGQSTGAGSVPTPLASKTIPCRGRCADDFAKFKLMWDDDYYGDDHFSDDSILAAEEAAAIGTGPGGLGGYKRGLGAGSGQGIGGAGYRSGRHAVGRRGRFGARFGAGALYGSGGHAIPWYGSGGHAIPWYGSGGHAIPWYGSGGHAIPWYASGGHAIPWYGSGAGAGAGYGSGGYALPWWRSGAGAGAASNASTWKGDVCLVKNPGTEARCKTCDTHHPSKDSNSRVSNASTWGCNVCWYPNPGTEAKCKACKTPRSSKDSISKGAGVGSGGYGQGLGEESSARAGVDSRSGPLHPGMGPGGLFCHGHGSGEGSSARAGVGSGFGRGGQGLGARSRAAEAGVGSPIEPLPPRIPRNNFEEYEEFLRTL